MSNSQNIKIIGINIELKGTIAFSEGNLKTKEFKIIEVKQFPLMNNPSEIYHMIPNDTNIAVIEEPFLKPFQKLQTCAENYKCLGYIEMTLLTKNIAYYIISPSVWREKVITFTRKSKGKTTAILTCEKFFPYVELNGNTIKDRDNMAEAILIAYYSWLQEK